MSEEEQLNCTHNYSDYDIHKKDIQGITGRISYCMIKNSPHFFILIEKGSYTNECFNPSVSPVRVAFSYVPNSTHNFISNLYSTKKKDYSVKEIIKDAKCSKKLINKISLLTYIGYILFFFTDSFVIDTWKLTNDFVRLKSKPVTNWKFNRYYQFNIYNAISVIPYFGITDCIGYSNYHYEHADDQLNQSLYIPSGSLLRSLSGSLSGPLSRSFPTSSSRLLR